MDTYFYAQNLDNSSPDDHMYIGNEKVPYDLEYPPGFERINFINELASRKNNFTHFKYDEFNVFYSYNKNQYLIEMCTKEQDDLGRAGIILFSGNIDELSKQPEGLISAISIFAKDIKWDIDLPKVDRINRIARMIEKKISLKKKVFVLIGVVILLIIVISILSIKC